MMKPALSGRSQRDPLPPISGGDAGCPVRCGQGRGLWRGVPLSRPAPRPPSLAGVLQPGPANNQTPAQIRGIEWWVAINVAKLSGLLSRED
jgi:hypothetical protein